MSPIRRHFHLRVTGALALLLLSALAPQVHAAEYCVSTPSALQGALNQSEIDGEDSEIKVRSGTYSVSSNLVYQPSSEFFLTAGKLIIRGGYNSDCSSRTDADGATRFTGNGAPSLFAFTQTSSVSIAGLAFEGVHLQLDAREDTCIGNSPVFRVRRVRVTDASILLLSRCHDVLVENSLFVNAVSYPDAPFAGIALRVRMLDIDEEIRGSVTLINNTISNGTLDLSSFLEAIGVVSLYNNVFTSGSTEILARDMFILAINNRYDSLSLSGGSSLSPASANNVSTAANLDGDFTPSAGSAMRNSGAGTVPGGLSEIDQTGNDRVVGPSVDRGARESLIDGSGIYTVTNTATSGTGSLSWAIAQSNAESGFNRIAFNISGSGCPKVISVPSALIVNERLAIDGFSQPGAQVNTLEGNLWNGLPCVLLRGPNSGVGIETGGDLGTERLSITGLAFERFDLAVALLFGQDHSIQGSQFGGEIGNTGLILAGNEQAIALVGGLDTLIGGSFPSHRNLIGSSSDVGVLITTFLGLGGEGITIRNNLIGSDKDGSGSLPNGDGIRISGPNNVV
ncbi:MAG: hypothetical protein ABI650_03540, partial [Dokdonella sp.]